MDRVSCPHCGKQFKTESGRAYHLGWCKPGEPDQPDADQSADDAEFDRWLNEPCGEPEPADGGDEEARFWAELDDPDSEMSQKLDFLVQSMERLMAQTAQMKKAYFWEDLDLDPDGPDNKGSLPLLKQIQEQLELLECQDLLYVIGQRGIEEGARAILNIPGMREANSFYAWADERNAKYSSPVVVNCWLDVPGVREVIDRYQAEGRLQQATTVAVGQERQDRVDLVTQDIAQRVKDSIRRQRDGESPALNNGWGLPPLSG